MALGDLEADKELAELDVAMFSKAPVQAMEDTLAFLRYSAPELRVCYIFNDPCLPEDIA